MDRDDARLIWASILFAIAILLAGCSNPYTPPNRDSVETQNIYIQAIDIWEQMEIPCPPDPIYEVYEDGSGYIGVIGECTDVAIGVYYSTGFPPNFTVERP